MTTRITNAYTYYPFFDKGKPVFFGKVYIGIAGKNPKEFPQQSYAMQENGTSVALPVSVGAPALTLSAGGVPSYNGAPVVMTTGTDYSILIEDKNGTQVYYTAFATGEVQGDGSTVIDDFAQISQAALDAFNAEADNLISKGESALGALGGVHIGEYSTDPLITERNQYVTFGATPTASQWKITNSTSLDYQIDSTTYPDPEDDPNLIMFNDVTREYVNQNFDKFGTLASFVNDPNITIGMAVRVTDRADGIFDVVSGVVGANGTYIIAHDTLDLSFVLRVSNYMDIRAFGGDDLASDNSNVMTDAFNHPDAVVITGKADVAYNYTSNVSAFKSGIIFHSVHFHGIDAETFLVGTLTELGQLTAGGLKGTRDISFGTSAGIVRGDLLVIHDQWNEDAATYPPLGRGSFSQHRQAYMDGEYNRVANISGAILTMTNLLDGVGDYPIDPLTKIFKMEGIAVGLKNAKFTSYTTTGANNYSLTIKYGVKVRVDDSEVEARGSLSGALLLDKCHDVVVNSGSYFNDTVATSGRSYGIAVINCDTVNVNGADIYATRHAVTTGGDLSDGAVPNNKIIVNGSTLSNNGSIYCADFHGNTKNSYYKYNKISNDIGLAGQDVGAIGNTVIGGRANPPIELHEIVGGKIKIHCNKVSLAPSSIANKIIGWGSSTFAQQVDRPFHIEEISNEYTIKSSVVQIVTQLIQQDGDAQSVWTSDGCTINGDDSGLAAYYTASISNPASHASPPVPPVATSLTNLHYIPSNTFKWWDNVSGSFAGMRLTLPSVTSDAVALTVEAGNWNSTLGGISGQLLFNYPDYPAVPFITPTHQGWAKGAVPQFFATVGTATTAQCQVYISTADASITPVVNRVITVQAMVSFNNVIL